MTSPVAIRQRKPSPIRVGAEIRKLLKDGGSIGHATGVQWFFKDEIKSHGWYTAPLRRAAIRTRRELQKQFGLGFVVRVADQLFTGRILEQKVFAVFLLEKLTGQLGEQNFRCSSPGWIESAAGPITTAWY